LGIDAFHLTDWLGGAYLRSLDASILERALADRRVFVSYDQSTIPELLREWAGSGKHNAGVILIDARTIRQSDHGGQLTALRAFVAEHGGEDWTDQVRYLPRPR